MDESLQSSLSEEDSSSKEYSLPEEKNESRETPQSEQVEDRSQVESLLCGEEQLTLITESMSITSSDEEKLQLLNKNTELRRLNKELMKLNEEWDHIYHSTSVGLQQRVSALEEESSAVKQLNSRLLLKVEHEQNKREYYEHTLMQELKKNQHLQEYIRLLESRIHQTDVNHWTQKTSDISSTSDVLHRTAKSSVGIRSASGHSVSSQNGVKSISRLSGIERPSESDAVREVQDLKEQLEALRCQTQIYEADYKTEQKDHERMLQENKRLRRREGEMRQQMALLQEQLKVYEDDFQKERSDKRILQKLLMNKSPAVKDPVLVHRCNNDQDVSRAERRKHREERRAGYVCPKHCEHHRQLDLQ